MNEQDTLISKYLAGEASPEEAMALEDWIAAAPGNKEQFTRLFDIADAASGKVLYKKPLPATAWQDLLHTTKPARWQLGKWLLPGSGAVLALGVLTFVALKTTNPGEGGANAGYTTINPTPAGYNSLPPTSSVKPASKSRESDSSIAEPPTSSAEPASNSVKVVSNTAKSGSSLIISTDTLRKKQVAATSGKNEPPVKSVKNAAPPAKIAAANRIFDFRGIFATDAFHALEKGYRIRIVFPASPFKKVQFTGYFDNRPLQEVLDIMSRALEFEYQITDDGKVVSILRKGD